MYDDDEFDPYTHKLPKDEQKARNRQAAQEWAFGMTHARLLRTYEDAVKHPKDYTTAEFKALRRELLKALDGRR